MLPLMLLLTLLSGIFFNYYMIQYLALKRRNKQFQIWFPERRKKERKSIFKRWGEAYDESQWAISTKKMLNQANIPLKPSEYLILSVLIFIILWAFFAFALHIIPPIDGVLALLTVQIISRFFLNMRKNVRAKAFNEQLPDICRLLANSTKAGHTIQQGFELIAREIKPPAKHDFLHLTQELKLGDPFDAAMERFGQKYDSRELSLFIHTLSIQRKLGGNISEVMQMMAETLDQRKRVNEEINNATAETRSIAVMLLFMPVALVMVMGLIIPGFINPLFTIYGAILLATSGALLFISYLIIRKMTNIKV